MKHGGHWWRAYLRTWKSGIGKDDDDDGMLAYSNGHPYYVRKFAFQDGTYYNPWIGQWLHVTKDRIHIGQDEEDFDISERQSRKGRTDSK